LDAYVLGSHPGELPTHLLRTESGNRIRAMAEPDAESTKSAGRLQKQQQTGG